jgi:transposase
VAALSFEKIGKNRMLTTKQIMAINRLRLERKWPVRRIERHLQISRATIRKYLSPPTRCRIQVSRTHKLDPFKPTMAELVQQDPSLTTQGIFQQLRALGYNGGMTTVRNHLRSVRTALSQSLRYNGKREAFDWMHRLLQGAIPKKEISTAFSHVTELANLISAITEERLSMRNKAITVLARERGIVQSDVCSFLFIATKTATRYWTDYQRGGIERLFGRKPSSRQKVKDKRITQAVFALLHSPPSMFGINRSTWKLADLHSVLKKQGTDLCRESIRTIIKNAGYRWRKARIVLTSRDPEYRAKVDAIKHILRELKQSEAFFSVDEYGPFAVKKRGGRKRVAPTEEYTVPQMQKSKGCLIMTGALELSRNQVTHFYSKKKNTDEMIKMMDLLRTQYRDCGTIYLSWDAASWHMSKRLFTEISKRNVEAVGSGYPIVETAPLPAGSQFLNIIESVFSGMSRAIIHNSDYPSVDAAKNAIDYYFAARNESFRKQPKRAGGKIWGPERVATEFSDANNCKDPLYR